MSSRLMTWMFGKLPALGDFVSRGLDHERRDALDRWLSLGMQEARERFTEDFESRYDNAPPWCFVDCDASGQWSGGALCASTDRAGRRFPLMIASPSANADSAPAIAGGCLELLYEALAGGWDADRLVAEQVSPTETGWRVAEPAWALIAVEGPVFVLPGSQPQGIVSKMVEMAG